jgi:hypothetical protein
MFSDGLIVEPKAYHSLGPILRIISPDESRNIYKSSPIAWTITPVTITGVLCAKVFASSTVTVRTGPVNPYRSEAVSNGRGGGGLEPGPPKGGGGGSLEPGPECDGGLTPRPVKPWAKIVSAEKNNTKQQMKKNVYFFISIPPKTNLHIKKYAFIKIIKQEKYICYLQNLIGLPVFAVFLPAKISRFSVKNRLKCT